MKCRRMFRGVSAFVLAGLVAALVGCGAADDVGTTATTGPTTSGGLPPVAYPTGADQLVLRVEHGGGFVPVEVAFAELPYFSLFGDGNLISTGPMIEIYPPPVLPNLQVRPVSADGVQQILRWADEAGLLEKGVDWGQPTITDTGGTTITVVADGRTHVHEIYALGYEDGAGGLTPEQIAARERVLDFQAKLGTLDELLGGEVGPESPYEFEAVAVLIMPAASAEPDSSGIEPQILEWPLADLATLGEPGGVGRQATLAGSDLDAVLPLLQNSNTLTLWRSGEELYRLAVRPLLPDQVTAG